MRELQVILGFGGYVALLLWGVHMVQTGVQRAYGKALGIWLARAMGHPPRAFLTGLAITAAIQSSTATGLMVTNLASTGLVNLVPGLAAMLGANVGTTLIVQVLSFNPTFLAPGLILVGVWMFRRHAPGRAHDLGRTLVGLGLLLLALDQLVTMFEPLQNAPLLAVALQALEQTPVIALAAAAALAWASHSSVAVVILIMSLAHHGLVQPALAYALVLGANLGTAVNPVLEGVSDNNPASRRLPLGNLGTRLVGCLLGAAALPWAPDLMGLLGDDPAHAVANFHVLFNVLAAACFMPLLRPYARLLTHLLPQRSDPNDPARPIYLEVSAREVPAVALGQAAREALRLTDLFQESLQSTREALLSENVQAGSHARYLNNAIDQLDQSITGYLAKLDQETLSQDDQQYLKTILTFSMNISHAASLSGMGLLGHAAQLRRKHWLLDPAQRTELDATLERIRRNLQQAAALFVSGDRETARRLAYEKDYFRTLEAEATQRHIERIQVGRLEAADVGAFYLDILRDAGGVNAYLINASAYPVLERHGELRPNRLRDPAP
ncbi:Na/Pi cotransporter family protein [Castellaniella sp. GW247-6E4]|uniref:Na/Pi cotransporter family protein n=1 Tax=Castellaniella sp. GW247-6E4 TaxID=3140380 RepID=UPI003315C0D9